MYSSKDYEVAHCDYPPFADIENQASLVSLTVGLTYMQCRLAVAHMHDCLSWSELVSCVKSSTRPSNGRINRGRLFCESKDQMAIMRSEIMEAVELQPSDRLQHCPRAYLQPQTISSSMALGRYDLLSYYQLYSLHFVLCEDRSGDFVGDEISRVCENVLFHISSFELSGENYKNSHLIDNRLGFQCYYYLERDGDIITMTIEEMDTFAYRPRHKVLDRIKIQNWMYTYAAGYLSYLSRLIGGSSLASHVNLYIRKCLGYTLVDGSQDPVVERLVENIVERCGAKEEAYYSARQGSAAPGAQARRARMKKERIPNCYRLPTTGRA
tara:strand:- start:5139 stop:6113 length:975 start_codon:yes stop_codon:yes gene_type:complete